MKPDCKVNDIISVDLLNKAIVNDFGLQSQVISWQVENFAQKGDNYACFVTSLVVNFSKNKEEYQTSYILKINPQRPISSFTPMFESSYKREMIVLKEVIGGMNKQLKLLNLEPVRAPKLFARSFEKGKEILLIEDLRKKGFRMRERTKELDLKHTLLVVEELGRFHASSLLFEEKMKKSIPESFDYFEVWLNNNEILSFFNVLLGGQCDNTIMVLKEFPKYKKCISWLEKRRNRLAEFYRDLLSPSDRFNVLIHGDCRANNILFSYDINEDPNDVRFIDFQGSRKSSPSCDLNYFLYSSVENKVRRQHFPLIESTYYVAFNKVLNDSGKEAPFSLKELRQDMMNKKMFGLLSSILILPVSLAEGDEIWDLESLCNETLTDFVSDQKEKFSHMVNRNGPFKDRLLAVFDELIEFGLFEEKD